jgi:hypothetical protein
MITTRHKPDRSEALSNRKLSAANRNNEGEKGRVPSVRIEMVFSVGKKICVVLQCVLTEKPFCPCSAAVFASYILIDPNL